MLFRSCKYMGQVNIEYIQFSDLTLTLIIGTEDPDELEGDGGNNAKQEA